MNGEQKVGVVMVTLMCLIDICLIGGLVISSGYMVLGMSVIVICVLGYGWFMYSAGTWVGRRR